MFKQMFQIPTFGIVLTCQQVLKNAASVLRVACNLQFCYSAEKRQEIKIFTKTVADFFPKFSAAEFFEINKNLFLKMLGAVTTYLIVVVQFNASDSCKKALSQ